MSIRTTRYAEIRRLAADAAGRTVIEATLREVDGNVTAAARALELSARNLRREAIRLGLRAPGVQR